MTGKEYNFFCFNVVFIVVFMPFAMFWFCKRKPVIFYGRVEKIILLVFGFLLLFVVFFGLIDIGKSNIKGPLAIIKIFLEFGAIGVSVFYFVFLSFSLVVVVLAVAAENK